MSAILLHDDGTWIPKEIESSGILTLRRHGYDDKWIELDFERHLLEWDDQIILGPSMSLMASWMNPRELLHLELFLMCRNSVSLDFESSKYPGVNCSTTDDLKLNTAQSIGEKFPSYVGSSSPQVLLLGDVHNVMDGYPYRAAFGPWGGCGTFLLDSIDQNTWRTYGMANANEENISLLLDELGHPPVIALGRNAQKQCVNSGVDCGVVPHPQWVKRFAHKRLKHYGDLISEVSVTGEDRGSWKR